MLDPSMLHEHMPSHFVLVLELDQQCYFAVALAPETPPQQVQSKRCDALNLPLLKLLHVQQRRMINVQSWQTLTSLCTHVTDFISTTLCF